MTKWLVGNLIALLVLMSALDYLHLLVLFPIPLINHVD